MSRALNNEETSIYNLFSSAVTLKENNEFSNIHFTIKKQKLVVTNPLVYNIEGTDSILILGEPRQQRIDMDLLKKFYEEQLKMKLEGKDEKDNTTVLDTEKSISEFESEAFDDIGVKEEDVELIQSQINIGKDEIVKALKENNSDVVKAMAKLSK